MVKTFAKLAQTHVRIDLAGGRSIAVEMLPVSAKDMLDEFAERARSLGSVEAMDQLKADMVELISTVMPDEHAANLSRFDLDMLTELIAYLYYGDSDDLPEDEAKKN